MWNPDEDVEALLADFYPKFYGPAAGPMSEYWNAIFKAWTETIVTEHEYFLAPAIYTPGFVAFLRGKLEEAEKLVAPLAAKQNPTRNEKLYVDRIRFTRMSCDILDGYMTMVKTAATECDYAAAVAAGERALAIRERLTDTNGVFTTYRRYPEQGPAWWPGEVQQYRELLEFTSGAKGTLLAKLPLEWAFRRDPQNAGLAQGYAAKPVDLSYWNANKDKLTPANRKDYPDQWEVLRTDLYIQAQGIRHTDRQSFTGYAWYRTEVQMAAQAKAGAVHIRFPGLFNDCWLYVNGQEVAHRDMKNPIWWLNDYKFEWDVDLSGKLQEGKNTLALRLNNPHHFGGMFRRPFLYAAK